LEWLLLSFFPRTLFRFYCFCHHWKCSFRTALVNRGSKVNSAHSGIAWYKEILSWGTTLWREFTHTCFRGEPFSTSSRYSLQKRLFILRVEIECIWYSSCWQMSSPYVSVSPAVVSDFKLSFQHPSNVELLFLMPVLTALFQWWIEDGIQS